MTNQFLKIIIPIVIIVAIVASFSIFILNSEPGSTPDQSDEEIQASESTEIETKITINDPGLSSEEIVYDVLNKEIPSGYSFGNFHDNGLWSGMTGTRLENSDQMSSIRFTSQHTGMAERIQVSISSEEDYGIVIGLQKDDGFGNPSGKWLTEDAVLLNLTRSTIPLEHFDFEDPIPLQQGQVYHIIIKLQNATMNESPIYIRNFHSTVPARPLNFEDPDIYADDTMISSLRYDGQKWVDQKRWPIFILTYSDGTKEGQPYTLAAPWTIKDKIMVGQTIIPSSDYEIAKISFVVGKKGNVTEPLLYEIRDSENKILREGLFAQSDDVRDFKTWIEVTLDSPVLMNAGKLYRVVIYSNIPDSLDKIYRLYGHEFNSEDELGYGGTRHRLTISHDFGENWSAWNDADAIFKLTTIEK